MQKTICCNSKYNAPDDGHMRLKHVELRIHQSNYLVASSWHFTLFHDEDAWSNNPQILLYLFIRFARINYGWFTAISYKFNLSTYVQEQLVIGRRGCVQRQI